MGFRTLLQASASHDHSDIFLDHSDIADFVFNNIFDVENFELVFNEPLKRKVFILNKNIPLSYKCF